MTRQRVGLRAPREGDPAQLPRIHDDGPWHRCIDGRHAQPWWFSTRTDNNDPGRFDLPTPSGTCYLAGDPAAAIIERCAEPDADDPPPPTTRMLAGLRVWSGTLDDGSQLADTTRASVPRLTAELATVVPFDLPHAWADAMALAGARGLLYTSRFASELALALFGLAGAPDPNDRNDPRSAGALRPSGALDHLDELPPALRAVAVEDLDGFTPGPSPAPDRDAKA